MFDFGGKDNFWVRRRCWLLPSTLWGPGRLGQGRLEKAGLLLPPSRSLALLGFSADCRPRKLEPLSKHREFSTASDGSGSRLCHAKDEEFFFFFFFKGNELNFYPALVQGLECKHPVIATHPGSAGISQESKLRAACVLSFPHWDLLYRDGIFNQERNFLSR